jgi:hypothetical protein
LGKIAVTNVGGVQGDRWILRQVRRFLSKPSRISRYPNRMSVEIEPAVRPSEALEQPASEKSRGTRDQDALAAQLLPQRFRSREDVIEIACQPVRCFCVTHG